MSVQALTADGWKIVTASATGPGSNVAVSAGAAANVDLTVSANPAQIKEILAVQSVSGLPDGVVLVGFSFPNISTLRLRVFNPTSTDKTVTAGSVSAVITAKAS
jgi:lipid-binding SYLF domain-containing protein